jgi:hypothetical protein
LSVSFHAARELIWDRGKKLVCLETDWQGQPWKGLTFLSYPPLPFPLLTSTWGLLIGIAYSLHHSSWLVLSFRLPSCRPNNLCTWRLNPKEHHQSWHCHENLKSHIFHLGFVIYYWTVGISISIYH